MLLLVGLGNPGGEYSANRHNIGFMAVDAVHRHYSFGPWRSRFSGLIAEGSLGSARALLLKPQTYMNDSGRSVGEAMRFYKLTPEDVVVIHDELDLPSAKIRMKAGGGHGGHNGLRSVSQHIGDNYRRLRLGIGHPGDKARVHGHVLQDFAKADREWVDLLIGAIADNAPLLTEGKDATFANRLHLALEPPKPDKKEKPAKQLAPSPDSASELKRNAETPAAKPAEGPLARSLRRLFGERA